MFQFLFKYPSPVFTKGRFVLLSPLPVWLLLLLIAVCSGGLALLIRRRLNNATPGLRSWRGWVVWGMQSTVASLLLLLLWRPAMTVAALSSQKNIIAVVIDDSRSMAIRDSGGATREEAALAVLQNGLLSGLQKRFQTRIYRLGNGITKVENLKDITPVEVATHIGDSLQQLATETLNLPIGAILLLTDGSENTDGINNSAISLEAFRSLRDRRLPVHTIGFGELRKKHDIEIEYIDVAANAIANGKVSATVSWKQYGYAGAKTTLTVRDGNTALVSREVTLAPNGIIQTESFFFLQGLQVRRFFDLE